LQDLGIISKLKDTNKKIKRKYSTEAIRPLFPLPSSKKHISDQKIGRLEPTPALKYRGLEEVQATG